MNRVAGLVTGILITALLSSCTGENAPEKKPPEETKATAQSFKSLTIEGDSLVKNGRWLLKAENASADTMGKVGRMEGIAAALNDADGEILVTADACSFTGDSVITLDGDVKVVWKGYSARGKSLTFDLKAGTLSSEDEIELQGDFIKVAGKGLRVVAEGRIARIDKDVHAVLGRM